MDLGTTLLPQPMVVVLETEIEKNGWVEMTTPVYESVVADFKDAKESMKLLAKAEVLAETIADLKSVVKPTKQLLDVIARLEAQLATVHVAKKGKK